jgi:formate-dependent nitrite reductase membrane component NrfD
LEIISTFASSRSLWVSGVIFIILYMVYHVIFGMPCL